MLQSFVPAEEVYFGFNAVSWSISNEMFYYLLFPGLMFLLYKKKTLLLWFAVLVLVLLLVMLVSPDEQLVYIFGINPLFRVSDFIIGVLLYRIYEKRIFYGLFRNSVIGTFMEIGSVLTLILFLFLHLKIPVGLRISVYYWFPMMFIVLSFAHQKGRLSHWLSHRFLILLGEISFSFYMLHGLLMRYFLALDRRVHWVENVYVQMGIILVIVLLASYFSYKYLELPSNSYLRKKLNSNTKSLQTTYIKPVPKEEEAF